MVWKIWCVSGLAMLLFGCEANPKRADLEGRILLQEDDLAHLIHVVRQTPDRIEGDLLRVRTRIKNRTDDDLWVDVQMVWKDDQGYELYATNWAPLFLPARFVTKHEVASLRPDVADYELRLRNPTKTVEID